MSSKNGVDPKAWSLAARLTAWYTAFSFALVAVSTVALYLAFIHELDREDVQALRDQVRVLRQVLRQQSSDAETVRRQADWIWASRPSSLTHVRILDDAGRLVVETKGMGDALPENAFPDPLDVDRDAERGREHAAAGKTYRLVAARAPSGSPASGAFVVQVALDETPEEELIAEYRRNLVLVLGIALVACTLGGYQIARRGVRPVNAITEAAQRVRATHLDERIETTGLPGELQALARTFNAMLDRLADSFERLARFSAEIAHELRTPINNLRGEVEVALGKKRSADEYRDSLGSALEECDRLTRMIDGLLFLARAEQPAAQTKRERLDLAVELEAVRAFYEAAAAESGVLLAVRCPEPVFAEIDRAMFQRAIGNLISNALAHTPRGGAITLLACHEAGVALIEVSDSGCGIAAEHLPFLFDRFYRVDRSRSSAEGNVGLGLAIVKGIVELHGGRATVESREGLGTRVSLRLPIEPMPAR